jgi:hypothetical protein
METDPRETASGPETTVVRRRRRRRRRSSGTHRPRRDPLVQVEWAVALAAAAAAVSFHLVFLTHAGGLWRDEVSVVNTASASSLGEFWSLARFESVPVPWLIALRLWVSVGLGASDMTLRVFGVLGGLALPAAVWFALRRLTRAAPLASMALIAVNPEMIRWGATLHGWGFGAALAILTMALMREASVALTRRRILFAALAAVLAVQCQYQNAVLVAAVAVAATSVATVRRRWAEALVPIGIGAVAIVSLVPYAGLLQDGAAWRALGREPITLGDLGAAAWDVGTSSGTVVITCAIGLVAMGLLAAVQWQLSPDAESTNRSRRGVANFAAAAFVLATAALAVAYLIAGYPPGPWCSVGLLSFVAVCAEVAVASAVQARVARITNVVLAGVVLAAGVLPAWSALHERQTNVDVIAARLNAEADRADLIVVNPWVLATGFTRYYKGDADVLTVPPIADHRVARYDFLKADMTAADPLAPVFARMQAVLSAGRQVWIVGGLDVPRAGERPARLPSPPLTDTGWSAAPYLHAWSIDTGAFLAAHSTEGGEVPVGASGGRFETAGLAMFKGWR